MQTLDLIIIFGYLVGITLFGIWFAGKQETTEDYFVGDRSVPWWAIAASIVATETSTITFISVPGVAFARGGNFQFLQLVLRLHAGARRHLAPLHPVVLSRRASDRLPAARAALRRTHQDAGGGALRRHAQHRRRHTAAADGHRARGRLRLVPAAARTSTTTSTIASIVLLGRRDDRLHLLRRDGGGHLGRGRAARHLSSRARSRRRCSSLRVAHRRAASAARSRSASSSGSSTSSTSASGDTATRFSAAVHRREAGSLTLPVDLTKTLHALGRAHRRLLPDDEHARHRSVSRPALPLHRQAAPRGGGASVERRGRASRSSSASSSSACCSSPSTGRTRPGSTRTSPPRARRRTRPRPRALPLRPRVRADGERHVSVRGRRPSLPGLHHAAHAVGAFGARRRGHLRRRALVVAELDCGDGGQRPLQAVQAEARGQALPARLALADARVGRRADGVAILCDAA